jgi:hypothetical protein
MLHSIRHAILLYTQGINRHITGLCIAEDEDVVLPPVILPPVVVLFPDVAFCANVDIVVEFSAAIILAANTAATIKPPTLRVFCITCSTQHILFKDWQYDIYVRNIYLINPISLFFFISILIS